MGIRKNKGHKYPDVIGRDFTFSPIGNHKHPIVQKSADKGEIFAKEYVKHFNAVWAARVAGMCVAPQKGNLKNIGIKSCPKSKYRHLIEKELRNMGEIAKRQGISPEMVIDELAAIAFNSDGLFCSEPNLRVSVDHKLKALDMLAKYLGLYEKDNLQKTADTQVLQVAFVGADYAETQMKLAKKQKEVVDDSVDKNPALVKRTKKLKARLVGDKTLDLSAFAAKPTNEG